jgi:hypothetical protein
MRKQTLSVLLVSALVGLLTVSASFAETVAERFEKNLKEIAAACAKRKLARNEVCGEVTKLKPADPLATEEGRFAHSIKIPNPVPADSGYKSGMTTEQYFEHLCKTEAGEFIYKTVENVEGLHMMRPRKQASDDELSHLYALEDPYGHVTDEAYKPELSYVQPATGKYQFLEMPISEGSRGQDASKKYRRYYRDPDAHPGKKYQTAIGGRGVFVPYLVAEAETTELKSRYGYIWRSVKRPNDRELGIAGGELIILDLKTNEVMAVRRGYMRTGFVRNNLTGVWWLTGPSCPNRGLKLPHTFIQEVLKPLLSEIKEIKDGTR